ncbi:MAG: hypothetical protein ABSG28_01085 [Methanoregula sp.]|jgi:hypothetical protein|uniref:hypothetical protein n=1 Tax=Methanoregula sp. TaxID=2052170 RepID=UPI003C2806F7
MTRVSEISEHWFGLCRKPPVVHVLQTGIGIPPESAYEGLPDGGGGGSGTIRRGIGAVLSGTKTLIHNRQLLWFTLLAGLVLAGNTLGQAALYAIDWTWATQPLNFLIEFATLFSLVFLLAGLVLSIPSKREGSASFFEGLARAKKYLKAIFLWSFVLALAGILLYIIFFYLPVWFPHELGFLYGFWHLEPFLTTWFLQFPFNLTLYPMKTIGDPVVGLSWIYPYGFMQALIFSAINLLLFILTPFVVPSIVLEKKTIREAVVGSFALMKKTWAEVAACTVFLGVVAFGVFLTYYLVQAAHGMVTPRVFVFSRPAGTWFALGVLYDLALLGIAFVVATVGGIAALDLYLSAKGRQVTGSPEPEPHA